MEKAFEQHIHRIFNLLRGSLATDEYHVILFLLTLHREGLLRELEYINPFERRFRLDDLIEGDLIAHNESFEELYDRFYQSILQNIPIDHFSELTHLILQIDPEESFAEIFDYVLTRILQTGNKGTFFITPAPIAAFAISLVEVPKKANIYNPFAGLASFGILKKDQQRYFGQEIFGAAWAIGLLRLYAHDVLPIGSFLNESSIQEWYPRYQGRATTLEKMLSTNAERKKDVDLLISAPPFGYKSPDMEYRFHKKHTAESLVIEQGLDILSAKGKIVCLVSNGRLFSAGTDQALRTRLITEDLLEMVISFPPSLLHNTSIPFSILVINKTKQTPGIVKFIDAASFITREKRNWAFDGPALLKQIQSGQESAVVKLVPNKQIKDQDYNFNVQRYFVERLPESTAVGELGEIFASGVVQEKVGNLITREWLQQDPLDILISNTIVPYSMLSAQNRQITESCFLISTTGGTIRLAYFQYEGIPFYIAPDIFPFRLTAAAVDPGYFALQLLSGEVQNQVRSYSSGSAIQRLAKKDFLNLLLRIPELSSQEDSLLHQQFIVSSSQSTYRRAKEMERNYQRQLTSLKEEATRNFLSMKHTFRQYLSALKSNTLGTKKFLENHDGKTISMDMVYSNKLNQNLGSHLQNVDTLIASLSSLLEEGSGNGTAQSVNLKEFISSFQQEFTFDRKFRYEFSIDELSFRTQDLKIVRPIISIDPQQLKKAFSNIVINALEHGFKGTEDYIILFDLWLEEKELHLEVSNNGEPMAEGFGLTELTTRGEKTLDSQGTGLGGYDLKAILAQYQAQLSLDNNPQDEFPVVYQITFPLISQ